MLKLTYCCVQSYFRNKKTKSKLRQHSFIIYFLPSHFLAPKFHCKFANPLFLSSRSTFSSGCFDKIKQCKCNNFLTRIKHTTYNDSSDIVNHRVLSVNYEETVIAIPQNTYPRFLRCTHLLLTIISITDAHHQKSRNNNRNHTI